MSVPTLTPEQLTALTSAAEPLMKAFHAVIRAQASPTLDGRVVLFSLVTLATRLLHGLIETTPADQRSGVAAFGWALIAYFDSVAAASLPGDPALLRSANRVHLDIVRSQLRLMPELRVVVEQHIADLEAALARVPATPHSH